MKKTEMIEKLRELVDFRPTYSDYKLGRRWHRRQTNRAPRLTLKKMAEFINEFLPGYTAKIKEGYHSGDSKISGTRLRSEGKDYHGTRIIITDDNKKALGKFSARNNVVLDHNSAEPYRENKEVASWILNSLNINH